MYDAGEFLTSLASAINTLSGVFYSERTLSQPLFRFAKLLWHRPAWGTIVRLHSKVALTVVILFCHSRYFSRLAPGQDWHKEPWAVGNNLWPHWADPLGLWPKHLCSNGWIWPNFWYVCCGTLVHAFLGYVWVIFKNHQMIAGCCNQIRISAYFSWLLGESCSEKVLNMFAGHFCDAQKGNCRMPCNKKGLGRCFKKSWCVLLCALYISSEPFQSQIVC